jgi:methylenetetrahydrofolate reductase (NADPH)
MNYTIPIALELVPKNLETLLQEAQESLQYSAVCAINIPEIRSIPIKSFEATKHLLVHNMEVIPHFRTIDRTPEQMEPLLAQLCELGLKQVLFITGDPPTDDPDFVHSQATPIDMVRYLKPKFPQLLFYGALDPYRQNMQDELRYAKQKLEAGYDGLFSQPFFHPDILRFYLEQLQGYEVYVGVSPVTSAGSLSYWENTNKVVFPVGFQTELAYNCTLAHSLLALAQEYKQPAYLMPITISSKKYLNALFQ